MMAGIPSAKQGQIKIQWGKLKDCDPDLILCNGEDAGRADVRLLYYAVEAKTYNRLTEKYEVGCLEELERRGYDLKTLKISIEKKLKGD
jgi:hypothetical protein